MQTLYGTYIPISYVINYFYPFKMLPFVLVYAVDESALHYTLEVLFFLEAKVIGKLTCIAGRWLIFYLYKKADQSLPIAIWSE